MSERIDALTPTLFLDGPAEYLAKSIAVEIALVTQWATLFGDAIEHYQRFDFGMRELPALRIYNVTYRKEFDSWFITGDITLDIIFPASIRRDDLQDIPDRVSSALVQQFRRPGFFDAVEDRVPGLNELGKTVSVDKGLGFNFGKEDGEIVPLTQINVNFRIDLREWDAYLESEGRTKEDPFEETLENLEQIASTIRALDDDDSTGVEVDIDQEI